MKKEWNEKKELFKWKWLQRIQMIFIFWSWLSHSFHSTWQTRITEGRWPKKERCWVRWFERAKVGSPSNTLKAVPLPARRQRLQPLTLMSVQLVIWMSLTCCSRSHSFLLTLFAIRLKLTRSRATSYIRTAGMVGGRVNDLSRRYVLNSPLNKNKKTQRLR